MLDENRPAHPVAPTQGPWESQVTGADGLVREPLALIGIGCHFPGGATSPQAFWELLCSGTDATREVPTDRWDVRKFYDPDPNKSGKMNTYRGGYLERIDQFDPHFFGISPREAMWLDPQQRLLLQATWEALEDAGQVADRLAGSNTGVFIAGFALDYYLMQNFGVFSRYELQAHSATGMMMTMLANRISYVFGFHGPSLAVDTACSGSLVAVHLACQSLWSGECSLALAGGANVMVAPTMTIAESKGGFLSPDGLCKTFDASANGYARGEGAGVVLIKPLAKALADGDPIYALIRGSAVTQDGHTNGITVPNRQAQEAAMRIAYHRAGILPEQVQYVEAHGTGTPVGDPLEARAIGTVLSAGRPADERCTVGSVKTNIGHLEAAAGVAGLMKTALALKNRQIPPHLHFHHPHPDIPFDELQLHVPTTLEAWPATDGPRYAGVNSFGFGGTNAHVVLQEAPCVPENVAQTEVVEQPYLLPLSARSPEALQAMAASYRTFLADTQSSTPLHDIVYSASQRRSHHDHRLTLVAHSKAEAVSNLEAFLADAPRSGTSTGRTALGERPKIVFVCSGMGPQWWAMGRDLLEHEVVFRASIERCDAELSRYTGWSLLEALTAPEESSRMADAEVAEPANFAIQVALAELWRSRGIEPDAVIGHSTGEFAAHYLAGALSFADAVKVVYHHSRLLQRTSGNGRMLAVGMSYETLSKAELDTVADVSIAAINGPIAVTLSGDEAALENIAQQLETFQVFHRFLVGTVPYHSTFVEPLRDELLAALSDLHPTLASLPLYSTVTGTRIDGSGDDARYWWQNARTTVLFSSALDQMIQDGYSVFLELSPHPVLASSILELLAQQGEAGTVLPSLRRKEEDRATMLGSLGSLYTMGYPIRWQTLSAHTGAFVRLPSYPWQLKPYWTESMESREDRLLTPVHPLLGQRMGAAHPTWELEVNSRLLPYLADHRIQGSVILPGAVWIEMALAAAREIFGEGIYSVEELAFRKALFLPEVSDPRLQTVLHPQQATVEIYSYTPTASGEARWSLHASARLRQSQPGELAPCLDLGAIRERCNAQTSREEFYQLSQQMGFQYGPAFQAIERVDTGPGIALGQLQIPASVEADLASYIFHPTLIDAAFQILLTATRSEKMASDEQKSTPYLPVGVDRIRILGRPVPQMQAYARLRQADDRLVVGDIQVVDSEGNLLAEIEGFRAQSLEASMSLAPERIDKGLYELEWQPSERVDDADIPSARVMAEDGSWLIFTDQSGVGEALIRRLEQQGERYVCVSPTDAPELIQQGERDYAINPSHPEHFQQLFAALSAQAPFSRVVHLWSLDSTFDSNSPVSMLEQEQVVGSQAIVYLIQMLAQSGWPHLPYVWLVTRGAQAVGAYPGPIAVEQAPVWGLGRVIGHQEFANIWGGLVDLDTAPAAEQAALLFDEIWHADDEDQVAFRAGQRYVARLVQSQHLTRPLPASFRPDGSYLITGGLGSLGLLVARWMVTQGARRLILMGRTQVPERSTWHQLAVEHPQRGLIRAIQELETLGATIHLAAVDAADEEQLATFLAVYEREGWPPIKGVIHTAGVVQDELLLRMTTETFQRVLRPKMRGGWLLHRLLKDKPLDFFILFSSTGSVIASLGQGNYAAGNAFLDALAHHRRAQGLPALSIGWGPWSVGMVEQLKLEQFYTRRGIELITPEIGRQILARVQGQRPTHLVAITVNWALARETSPVGMLPKMFSLLEEQAGDQAGSDNNSDDGSLLLQLSEAQAADRQPLVASHLQELVARVLQLDSTQFSDQESLTGLGLDSMMAIEVKHRIEGSLKVDISVLELLQEITIVQLTTRVLSSLQFADSPALAAAAPSSTEIQHLIEQVDSAELESLLAELEQTAESNDLESLLADLEQTLDSEASV